MPWPLLGRREGMSKQAAITALDECIKEIEAFGPSVPIRPNSTTTEGTAWANIRVLKERALTGMKIAMRLLSDPEPTEEIQIHIIEAPGDSKQQRPEQACPRCGNEEFGAGDKYCQICGLPLFVAKS